MEWCKEGFFFFPPLPFSGRAERGLNTSPNCVHVREVTFALSVIFFAFSRFQLVCFQDKQILSLLYGVMLLIQHFLNLFSFTQKFSALLLLRLAFQSLGVVYGDLGTSPLYVFYNTFPHGIQDPEDVIGALSLIIYSLTLIPLLKYVFIVCRANDNGQGKLIYILLSIVYFLLFIWAHIGKIYKF